VLLIASNYLKIIAMLTKCQAGARFLFLRGDIYWVNFRASTRFRACKLLIQDKSAGNIYSFMPSNLLRDHALQIK